MRVPDMFSAPEAAGVRSKATVRPMALGPTSAEWSKANIRTRDAEVVSTMANLEGQGETGLAEAETTSVGAAIGATIMAVTIGAVNAGVSVRTDTRAAIGVTIAAAAIGATNADVDGAAATVADRTLKATAETEGQCASCS